MSICDRCGTIKCFVSYMSLTYHIYIDTKTLISRLSWKIQSWYFNTTAIMAIPSLHQMSTFISSILVSQYLFKCFTYMHTYSVVRIHNTVYLFITVIDGTIETSHVRDHYMISVVWIGYDYTPNTYITVTAQMWYMMLYHIYSIYSHNIHIGYVLIQLVRTMTWAVYSVKARTTSKDTSY